MDTARPVIVASAVDQGYLRFTAVVAHSMARHASSDRAIEYHILYDGEQNRTSRWLDGRRIGRLSIRIHYLPNPFAFLGQISNYPPSTFFRLAVPQVLAQHDRAVFLDPDLLVLDDVSKLFDADLGGRPVGAAICMDTVNRALSGQVFEFDDHRIGVSDYMGEVLGLDTPARVLRYIQCGVQLLDLSALRQMDYARLMVETTQRLKHRLRYADQCAANAVLVDRTHPIDPRWNVYPRTIRRGETLALPLAELQAQQRQRPAILHYAGAKPWNRWVPGATRWWAAAIPAGYLRLSYRSMLRHWVAGVLTKARDSFPRPYAVVRRAARRVLGWDRSA